MERTALRVVGTRPDDRLRLVRAMVLRRRREAPAYWVHLMLSVGIATLGLALSSTAVVIGAMLISPLMGPIVELGMGLVTGSPVLTLRSLARTAGSVGAAVLGAALLTLLLPFREITPEVAARTSPTALDLLIAVFVAVVAVFTTVRSSSDTASTAAGTAIGISLVPPLCVAGFGLGSHNAAVAGGSALLFLTNFTAIVAVAVLCFLVLGFEHVDTDSWERRLLRTTRARGVQRAAHVLRGVFGWRYGRVLRVGVPLTLLAAVMVPLAGALEQVTWEVRTRGLVARALDEVSPGDVVQSSVSIRGRSVAVRLYVVGTPAEAAALEQRLADRVGAQVGIEPTVRVVAVPQAAVDARAEPVPGDPAAGRAELVALRSRLDGALRRAWAAAGAGEIVGWDLRLGDSARAVAHVRHLGTVLPPSSTGLLGQIVSGAAGFPVGVSAEAIPARVSAPPRLAGAWVAHLERVPAVLAENPALRACVTVPAAGVPGAGLARIDTLLARIPAGRAERGAGGDSLVVRLGRGPCGGAVPPAAGPP